MTWQRVVVILGALSVLVIIWLGRYDLVAATVGGEGAHGIVYRLDRWTGRIVAIGGGESLEIKIEK